MRLWTRMVAIVAMVMVWGASTSLAQFEADFEAGGDADPEAGLTADTRGDDGFTTTTAARNTSLPLPLAQRPLNLPRGVLRVDADLSLLRYPSFEFDGLDVRETSDIAFSLNAGAGIGITDDIEAGIMLLPLQLTPDFEYRDIVLYGQYQFLRGNIEMGARLELNIPTQSHFGLSLGLPVLIRATDNVRIDTGLQFALFFPDGARAGLYSFYWHPMPTRSTTGIPLIVNFNLTDEVFLGLRTGLGVSDFGNFGDSIFLPLGIQGGYSLPVGDTMLADFALRFEFPWFIQTGGDDTVITEVWQISASANLHFDLF